MSKIFSLLLAAMMCLIFVIGCDTALQTSPNQQSPNRHRIVIPINPPRSVDKLTNKLPQGVRLGGFAVIEEGGHTLEVRILPTDSANDAANAYQRALKKHLETMTRLWEGDAEMQGDLNALMSAANRQRSPSEIIVKNVGLVGSPEGIIEFENSLATNEGQ